MIFHRYSRQYGALRTARFLSWLSIFGWSCLIAALVVFHYARPELQYGILTYFGVQARTSWVADLRIWYVILLTGCAAISLVSLVINKMYISHGHHRIRYNVVLLLLISSAMLIALAVDL